MGRWIVVGTDGVLRMKCYGTSVRGVPLRDREAAERLAKKMERLVPECEWLALEIRPSVI